MHVSLLYSRLAQPAVQPMLLPPLLWRRHASQLGAEAWCVADPHHVKRAAAALYGEGVDINSLHCRRRKLIKHHDSDRPPFYGSVPCARRWLACALLCTVAQIHQQTACPLHPDPAGVAFIGRDKCNFLGAGLLWCLTSFLPSILASATNPDIDSNPMIAVFP